MTRGLLSSGSLEEAESVEKPDRKPSDPLGPRGYVTPEETENGALGYCAAVPRDQRGTLVERFPLALLADIVTPDNVEAWGEEHLDVTVCPHGLWGPEQLSGTEIPWCEDGDGCRILGYAWDMRNGDIFPPIVVVYEYVPVGFGGPEHGWCIEDGWHRAAAYLFNGVTHVPAVLFSDFGPADPHIAALACAERVHHIEKGTP